MREKLKSKIKENKAITLVALVITIIVLIILAVTSINLVLSEDGMFQRIENSKKMQNQEAAREKLALAILNLQVEKQNQIELEYLIEITDKDIEVETSNGKVIIYEEATKEYAICNVSGYKFKVYNDLEIVIVGDKKAENENIVLSYKVKDNSKNINKRKYTQLIDSTQNNNDASLYNIELTSGSDGLVFDGTSSYVLADLQEDLTFPLTLEMNLTASNGDSKQIIYTNPELGISFGAYVSNGYFICSGTVGKTYTIPSDFFDGNKKHIVITYNSATDYTVYVNGNKLTENSTRDNWNLGSSTYIGRRDSGNYFSGTIYEFNIYERIISQEELNSTINDNGLVLKYEITDTSIIYEDIPYIMEDMANNGNNATLYNVEYNNTNDGLEFNGTSSYASVDLQEELIFPLTLEMYLIANNGESKQIIYTNPELGISFGAYVSNGYFICSGTVGKTYTIPSDFFDGNKKHIVITYNSATDYTVYVNGNKLTENSTIDNWNLGSLAYIGRRDSGNYFSGTLYEFNIYSEVLSEDKINEQYEKMKHNY